VLLTVGGDAFSFCTSLPAASFPRVATVEAFAFNPCRNLSEINLPSVTEVSDFTFSNCDSLTAAAFGAFFDAQTTVRFRQNVFGAGNRLTNRMDLKLGENVLPRPKTADNTWQSDSHSDYSWRSITVNPYTGTENVPAVNPLFIYPNPVAESFRIAGLAESSTLTVVDLSGKTVLRQTVHPDETVFVRHLPKGFYVAILKGMTAKIIKN
jgi:hypothetical protein